MLEFVKLGMELSNLSFRQWLCNHCHSFLHTGSYELHIWPNFWRFNLSNNPQPYTCLNSPVSAMCFAAEHHAKGMFAFIVPTLHCRDIMSQSISFLFFLNIDRKNLLNWSSTWSKPMVCISSWSFTSFLINPMCNDFVSFDPLCLIQARMQSQLRLSQVTCCRYSLFVGTSKIIAC